MKQMGLLSLQMAILNFEELCIVAHGVKFLLFPVLFFELELQVDLEIFILALRLFQAHLQNFFLVLQAFDRPHDTKHSSVRY